MKKNTEHYGSNGNSKGFSEEKTSFFGNEYTQHYDSDGNKSGTSEKKTGFFGNEYVQHYDSDGNKSGTSEEKSGFFGNEYTQHYDSDGNKSGISEEKTGFFGNEYTQHYDSDGSKSGTSEEKTGGCFLTTACVQSQGLPDDCAELNVLRQFRDNFLRKSTQGVQLISEYYQIAPAIIRAINSGKNAKAVYDEIYSSLILPCVSLIRHGHYSDARELYTRCVSDLASRFLPKR